MRAFDTNQYNAGEATNWGYQVYQADTENGDLTAGYKGTGTVKASLKEMADAFTVEYPDIPTTEITQVRMGTWNGIKVTGMTLPDLIVDTVPGSTDFNNGDPTNVIKPASSGVLKDDGGKYILNVVNAAGEEDNILGDSVTDLSGAVAIGVHFEVSEFEDYGKEFNVDILVSDNGGSNQANFTDAEGEVYADGVTTEAAKVTGNGDYIAWAMFDEPIEVTDDFYMALVTSIEKAAAAELEADDGLPVIKVLEIGVQDGTPAQEDTSSDNETSDNPPTADDSDDTSTPDDNPGTGVTLAVVPAALAAAALVGATVAIKKRK